MDKKVARVGDIHKGVCDHGVPNCCPHSVTGVISEGYAGFQNEKDLARKGDKVTHNCPHCGTGTITTGSGFVKVGGKELARVGDTVTYPGGTGKIISGSDLVTENGVD